MVTANEIGGGGADGATHRAHAGEHSAVQVEQLEQALVNCLETTKSLLAELDHSHLPPSASTAFLRDQLTAGQSLVEHFLRQVTQSESAIHSRSQIAAYVEIQQENNAFNKEDISYLRALHTEMEALGQDLERLQRQAEAQRQIKVALPTGSLPPSLENLIEERSQQLRLLGDRLRSLSNEIETLSLEEQRAKVPRLFGELKIHVKREDALSSQVQRAFEDSWTIARDLREHINQMAALQDRLTSLETPEASEFLKELAFELNVLKAYQRKLKESPTDSSIEKIKADLESIRIKLPEGDFQVQTLDNRPIFVGERVCPIGDKTYYAAHLPKGAKAPRPLIGVPTGEIPEQYRLQPTLGVTFHKKNQQFSFTAAPAKQQDDISTTESLEKQKRRRTRPKL